MLFFYAVAALSVASNREKFGLNVISLKPSDKIYHAQDVRRLTEKQIRKGLEGVYLSHFSSGHANVRCHSSRFGFIVIGGMAKFFFFGDITKRFFIAGCLENATRTVRLLVLQLRKKRPVFFVFSLFFSLRDANYMTIALVSACIIPHAEIKRSTEETDMARTLKG